uniref:Secreted protein n=1 Tax=Setaria viridis TaxID=4556 RepID=A0A4U6VYV0_SETVI|nr:hypothetical protein SEVIR_2G358350v2 [Setaria viridis]
MHLVLHSMCFCTGAAALRILLSPNHYRVSIRVVVFSSLDQLGTEHELILFCLLRTEHELILFCLLRGCLDGSSD